MDNNITKWVLLLTKLDGINRRVKEPGWFNEDKREVYSIKDELLSYILKEQPGDLDIECSYVPYYMFSQRSKDKAGELMRRDPDRKPFEYYLGQIEPGENDVEVPEKATVEIVITCAGQEFSFHQPVSWFTSNGGDLSELNKKAWISADIFHHKFLEKSREEINNLKKELEIN